MSTHASALLHRAATFTGNIGSSYAGKTVEIERKGRETGGRWDPTAHGLATSHGAFTAVWPANHIGQFAIRAVIVSVVSRAASASPSVQITVYRPAIATMYGPGFWGSRVHGLWRGPAPQHDRDRQPHTEVRHARGDLLPRQDDGRPRDRPRPVRQRRRLGSDAGDGQGDEHPRDGHDRRGLGFRALARRPAARGGRILAGPRSFSTPARPSTRPRTSPPRPPPAASSRRVRPLGTPRAQR